MDEEVGNEAFLDGVGKPNSTADLLINFSEGGLCSVTGGGELIFEPDNVGLSLLRGGDQCCEFIEGSSIAACGRV